MEYPREYLNKFEIARVLGLRTMQLTQEGCGAPTVHSRAEQVAIDELLHGQIPYIMRRTYPQGEVDVPLTSLRLSPDAVQNLHYIAQQMSAKSP